MNLTIKMKLYKLTTPTFHLKFRTSLGFSLSCDTHVSSVNLLYIYNYTLIPIVGRGSGINNWDVILAGRVVPTFMEVPGIPNESCACDNYAMKKSK